MMLQARPLGDEAGFLPLAALLFHILLAAMALLAGQATANPLPSPQQPSPQQPSPQQQPAGIDSTGGGGGAMGDELTRPTINGPISSDNQVVPQPGGNPVLTDVPPAKIDEDTGQVSINRPPDRPAQPALPIRATIFRGVPGPKACRGGAMTTLDFGAGAGAALRHTEEVCYDLPDTAGCGNFVANKADGCEARLFAERGCRMFVNLAVYQPEDRAVGGRWRSMAVRCGVPEPDPATLGAPPLAGMWSKKTSPKGGRRSATGPEAKARR
ncbi:hypothetical protein RB595_008042 [Gaeumannomyces hyphopodioides]